MGVGLVLSLSLHIGRMGGGYACTSNRTFMRHTNRTKNAGAYANHTHSRGRNDTTNAQCRMHRRQHPKRFMFASLPLSPLLLLMLLLLSCAMRTLSRIFMMLAERGICIRKLRKRALSRRLHTLLSCRMLDWERLQRVNSHNVIKNA